MRTAAIVNEKEGTAKVEVWESLNVDGMVGSGELAHVLVSWDIIF